jgi:hypothetical protein
LFESSAFLIDFFGELFLLMQELIEAASLSLDDGLRFEGALGV